MPSQLFFLLGLSFLLTHEMDAIRCTEWRIFPVTAAMADEAGYLAFTAVHVPLYAILLWGLVGGDANRGLVLALDAFFVVHACLHVLLRHLPKYGFRSAFSWALFLGAGLCGAIDLLLALR